MRDRWLYAFEGRLLDNEGQRDVRDLRAEHGVTMLRERTEALEGLGRC